MSRSTRGCICAGLAVWPVVAAFNGASDGTAIRQFVGSIFIVLALAFVFGFGDSTE